MSVENLRKFRKDLNENEELKRKFEEEMTSEGASSEKDYKIIVKIVQKLGYDITEEDFNSEKNTCVDSMRDGELDDEELDKVAGGYLWCGPDAPDGHEITCILTYYNSWADYFYDKNAVCANCGNKLSNDVLGEHKNKCGRQCYSCGKWTNVNSSGDGVVVADNPLAKYIIRSTAV